MQRTWQGTCHANPRLPTFLLQLRQRSIADADRKHADDDPLNGAKGEEACKAAEEAGIPSASSAAATWLARIGKCDAALRFPLWLGHPVVEHVNERWMAWISSAQEAESIAPCDEEGDNR